MTKNVFFYKLSQINKHLLLINFNFKLNVVFVIGVKWCILARAADDHVRNGQLFCVNECVYRELFDDIMSSDSRKLCFDGQELVQALVMHFEYDEKQGYVLWPRSGRTCAL